MLFSHSKLIPGVLAVFTMLISTEMTQLQAQTPNQTSVFVNYVNAGSNTDLSNSPTVYISFNGDDFSHRVPFIMDTGSVGIVASPDIFTPASGATNLGTGEQIYTSSGIIENGTWYTATQSIWDVNGNLLATSNVPVLQVTSITCTEHARSCTATSNPMHISVMGIGFARESASQVRGTPPYNAFLNLQSILQNGSLQPLPSNWCNGYVVTPSGVYLGLTPSNTANAGWVKLQPWPQYSTPGLPEWMSATMTINANGVAGDGNILMDTGVDTSFLTPPPGANLGSLMACPDDPALVECVPNNDVFGIYLPNQTNPVAFYSFTVGQTGNLMQPNGVHVENDGGTFLNTSRHVLGGIDFIYDNTHGYVGYIWNGMSGSNVGYVTPTANTSSTTVTTSRSNAPFGKKVVFTASVEGGDPFYTPTGTVTFIIDSKHKKVVSLDANGQATFSTSKLPPLVHTIQAVYSGDSQYNGSTSAVLQQQIAPPDCF